MGKVLALRQTDQLPDRLPIEEVQRALAACKTIDEARNIRDQAVAIEHYCRVHKASGVLQADAWEIRSRAERQIGKLLEPDREKRGRGKQFLPDTISRIQSAKWQKLARLPDRHYEGFVRAERKRIIEGKANRRGTEISSHPDYDGDEWYTPSEIIEAVYRVLGKIDLDPASCGVAQQTVNASSYYTKKQNGLTKPWKGRIFCNPPYSLAAKFGDRLLAEFRAGRVTEAIFFVASYTNNTFFQKMLRACEAVCFTKGQISFRRIRGVLRYRLTSECAMRDGHAFFYFGGNVKRFIRVFDALGVVLLPAP